MFRHLIRAGLAAFLLAAGFSHACAQDAHPWLDPTLLAAAKAEGGEMTIYSSTNEGEGLPLFKIFERGAPASRSITCAAPTPC